MLRYDHCLIHVSGMIKFAPGTTLTGSSSQAPPKDYSVPGTPVSKLFGVFESLAIITTAFGNGIIPEIQVGLAGVIQRIKISH